jgi:hypothetical protein
MYAMVKKVKVSPVKLMAHYWLTIPGLKKGGETYTSWVTRIANVFGLLDMQTLHISPHHNESLTIHFFIMLISLK